MFTDYYQILQITFVASSEEIKKSYRRLAKIWHPDLNKEPDAEAKMKLIVEAYLILSDTEARQRYDFEYQKYKQSQTEAESPPYKDSSQNSYKFEDEVLERWIANAKKQAKIVATQAYQDLKGTARNTLKYFIKSSGIAILFFFAALLLIILIGIIKRSM